MRALAGALGVWSLLAGCEVPITTLCPRFTLERSVSVEWIDRLDILIVIDDSASMAQEQPRIADELAEAVRLLSTGDRDADGRLDFEPYRSVRVGVVRTSMGGGGGAGCSADGPPGGWVTTSDRAGCPATYPDHRFALGPAHRSDGASPSDIGCVTASTRGCGVEQPLAAMRAALESAEFRREDAFLLILIATDEDDCSHDGLLTGDDDDPRAGCSGPTDLVAEYVSDIEGSAHPELTSVAVIAGVPPDIVDLPPDALLADPRMIPTLDGDSLAPSCGVGTSSATPPRRLVSWLAALERAHIATELQSICAPGATSRALDVLRASPAAPLSGGACFPRALPADAAGHVRCDVEIMLPLDDDGVTPMTCEDAGIDFVALGPTIDASSGRPRARCLVPQLTPDVLARGDTPGWGYDATSADAASACESGARAAFSQLERFNRVTITLRCEQPLPEGAPACTDGG